MKRKMNENAKASFCAGKKHSNRSARHIAGVVVGNLFVTLFSVSCLYPVIWLICASLNNKKDFTANPVALPSVPNFSNYGKVFSQTDMGLWMLNTLRNTAVSLPLILLFGFIAGYMLARCRFKGRTGLYCYFSPRHCHPDTCAHDPDVCAFQEKRISSTAGLRCPSHILHLGCRLQFS
jgi:ABC-type glycerol-3-phosphate transport system permease component